MVSLPGVELDVPRSQERQRSEVTTSPAWSRWSSRGFSAAVHDRCGRSPRCGSPPLGGETPPLGGRSRWRLSHLPPAPPATYAWTEMNSTKAILWQKCWILPQVYFDLTPESVTFIFFMYFVIPQNLLKSPLSPNLGVHLTFDFFVLAAQFWAGCPSISIGRADEPLSSHRTPTA